MSDDRAASEEKHGASLAPGAAVAALGLLALAIAAIEFYVFSDVVEPGAGSGDVGGGAFGMTTGTSAYVAGYAAAGVILFALGIWKIYRTRRGR
jgi:hypothetical protein